ncbi:MAG TPA: S26 family signal peptidase, partial [Pirellulales bacterium]|nr:S26 family signal peptidase [Pirellulales bacterium]
MASALGSPAGLTRNRFPVGPRARRTSTAFSFVRRWLQFSVLSLILFVLLRTWCIEGLVVPIRVAGPSMAYALKGPHASITCDACSFPFQFAREFTTDDRSPQCPNCGQLVEAAESAVARRGDKLWIDKCSLALREPRRWEAVIFQCPRRSAHYCVKRVVGLPGESIRVADGDVFVNGRIVQKSMDDLRKMAILVHDARFRRSSKSVRSRGWRRGKDAGWVESEAGFNYSSENGFEHSSDNGFDNGVASGKVARANDKPDWLWYVHQPREGNGTVTRSQSVTDDYGYNPSLSRALNEVDDLMLSAQVDVRGKGSLYLFASAHDSLVVRLQVHKGEGRLYVRNKLVHEFRFSQRLFSRRVLLQLATFDDRLQLSVDGAIVLVHAADDAPLPGDDHLKEEAAGFFETNSAASGSPLAVGAANLEVKLSNLRVYRDVYYTDVRTSEESGS